MKKSTNIIYYPAGCYGTFIEWSCYYFQGIISNLPFTNEGSSHNYVGNLFYPPELLFQFVNSDRQEEFVRCHPGLVDSNNIAEYLNTNNNYTVVSNDLSYLQKNFKNILVVYPTKKSYLWLENNVFQKVINSNETFDSWLKPLGYKKELFENSIGVKSIEQRIKELISTELETVNAQQWGKNDIFELETWELRELLVYYWFSRIKDSLTCWDDLTPLFPNIKFISLDSLRDNTIETIINYLDHFEIRVSDRDRVRDLYKDWEAKQTHIYKDQDVDLAVNAILKKQTYSWKDKNFTLLDEAYIQKSLLDNGIEIKCFNLNTFPTNTTDLFPLLEYL